ncbi:nucleolar pre-ribosomal-associated protein 1 isoform X1 [Oncorhynchus clarkii lewisi]|uniref:nucleolar pre-ribosomal-associated protein 1 isoform X1 n=1 Tax=Oncorhynchus clarkii lewisi TaxID=490388 RepID=UPI0039B9686E
MGKKRSSEDVDESKTHAKKGKVSETAEFNGTVFKAMLKEPTKAMKGLDTFITTAKKLPCPDLYDVVEGYIKISMECSEIFKLLEGDKQMESEMMLIFQSLEMILLRTASDLSHFSMVGFTIVKKAVSSYMKLIQTSLHSENHRFVRHCLSFLSAMVSQGADTAREVFSHFHFTKGLSALAKRKDKMGRPDVRMAYTQFALSFLVSGDNVTIGQLLEMKDFLPDILSSGLKEDRISTVNLILSTLQTKVVQRQAISKTQKVRFFTPSLLAQIASLYRWNGIVDASTDDGKMAENAEEAGKMVVRKLVHNFLLNLCCSRKHGISFYDPSFGTAGRAGNIVLLQFVVGLKQATEDDLVSDLMVNILRVSPDILPRFFKETQYSFIPRLKSAWTDNITLLKKIYESQPEVSKAFQTREVVPLPRLLSMVLVTSLPPVCNKAFFTQGINFANVVVQHTTLSLMSFLLKRAQRNMELCLDRSVWLASDLYTPATMQDFTQQYREALGKVLPDMTSIVSKWQSLTKKEKGGNEGKKEGDVKEDATKVEQPAPSGPESPEVIVLKALILQVMCLYQKVVPHLVSQSKFDFSKLLKGIVSEKGMREEVHPVLQHQILQLALDLPASKFSWFRVQDHVETSSGEKSVFFLLLKMFVSSNNNSHLKMSTRKLVVKVLKDSGVFEYTWSELELWLKHLDRLQTDQQDTVIHFLERVLMCLVCNPYTYTDKVASLVQEAAYLQANLSGQDGDTASIPISHIDDVLDMVDVIMEGSEGETEELGPALSDDLILQTFPFSAVVPAVLEARNKLPATYRTEKGVIYDYMATVLCDVLHCQRDPLPLSLALLQYDKELNSSEDPGPPHHSIIHLHHYYTTWLPQQAREPLFQSCESPFHVSPSPVTFTGLLKTAYTQGASALLEDSFRRRLEKSLVTMEMAEYPVAAKQILLYIKTTVDNFSMLSIDTGLLELNVLMGVLQGLVLRLQSPQEPTEEEPMVEGETEPMVEGETEPMVEGETEPMVATQKAAETAETMAVDPKVAAETEPIAMDQDTATVVDPAKAAEPKAVDLLNGSELFLEVNPSSEAEDDHSLVVLSVLSSILKHPCIEQWFLSLELSSVPPTSLNPVRLKLLCAQLSDCILGLLQSSASVLRPLNSLHLLSPYLEAVSRALLRELGETGERRETDKESRPVRAFMALHAYMEPPLLQELVSSLLLLPKETLITLREGDGEGEEDREKSPRAAELSVYGRTALQVLTETTSSSDASSSGSPVLLLSQAHLQGLATLLLSCSSPSLETFLLQALRTQPGNAKLLHTDILLQCLRGPLTAATQALGVALLQNCSAHRLCFEVWCLQPQHLETLADQTETFLPLVNSYLRTAAREDPTRPKEVQTAVLKALKKALFPRLSLSVLGQETGEALGAVEVVEALSSLVRLTAKVKDIRELIASLPAALQKLDGFERWQLVDPISAVLSVCPEELELWRTSVLSAALRWLSSSYGHNRDQNTAPLTQEDSILNRLTELLTFPEDITAAEWNSFVKAGLKCRYRDPNFLSTLNRMLDLMYGGSEGPKDLVPLPTIHMMASSHSLFLPIMLGDEEDLSGNTQVKEALVSLLLSLVKRSPAVCSSSHFVVLLGGYGATLSTTDQNLLLLLQEYERNGISLVDFQCMLWGPAAVEHHKARRSLGVSLWQQPSSEDLLALLSPDTMINTITHFPLQRRIILQEGKELIFKDEEVKDLGSVYDPCFLLPLFSAMLQPESVIDCLKFVSSHGLGVTMVSLSSYDPKLRAAAYQVLASYHHHLEAARFREKRQLLYLLDMVKNGIRQQNLRMPFVLTTYITKVARQMLKPEEHMYVVVNRFLLSHQCLDFRRVPEFFKLFYSCDMEHKMEREWILSVLEEGLKDRQCYDLLDQQGIFQTLLGFCCSPLCDQHTQTLIVRVLHQAGRVTKAAYNLTKGHGLLTWILQLLERRHVDQGLLSAVVELLHVLWFTNLGQKETRGEGASSSSSSTAKEDKPQGHSTPKVLPLPLISQFLCVATTIIRHLRLVKAGQLSLYLQTLSSILQHCGTALGVHGEAGWLTLRPQALSSQDALALLHRWSTLTHNAPLLSQLQTVAEKHKVKELLGSGREKGRGRSSSVQAQARSHSRPKEQEEEGEVERREEEKTLLEKCIPHLRNIFTHWEPVSLVCPPSSPASPPPSPDPHTPTSTPLANTTAHLLTRWFLNSLVEGASTYEDKRTVHFLRWFQKTVLSHRFIVDLVLADPAVRVDLLRLYHQACEAQTQPQPQPQTQPQPQAQISSRVEHVQLFTNIMIQLLESRGCTESDLHRAVLTACSLGTTCDDQTTKEGLMLLSLYIHEMWSGAKSPELFLNHVRLANEIQGSVGTKDQKKKSKRRSQTHTALRTICSDLLSGLQSTVAP